jgi:hypothetical protein
MFHSDDECMRVPLSVVYHTRSICSLLSKSQLSSTAAYNAALTAQTLGLIRPVQPPRDSISYTSKIPLIRLLAFPLLSPALAAATLSLFHMGTEAIFPLATFAWVTGALSRPPVFGNFTMRKTVSWIFFVSVGHNRRSSSTQIRFLLRRLCSLLSSLRSSNSRHPSRNGAQQPQLLRPHWRSWSHRRRLHSVRG